MSSAPTLQFEVAAWERGSLYVAGVDEVGRGAWAGPVVAAAVILPVVEETPTALADVRDSKLLSAAARERLAHIVTAHACAYGVGVVAAEVVDSLGLLVATSQAMNRALDALQMEPHEVFVDGLPMRGLTRQHRALVKGDRSCLSIAAASVVAKVTRDRLMATYNEQFPGYDFHTHKGYGTSVHRDALARLGPSPIHRLSYGPVASIVAQCWA